MDDLFSGLQHHLAQTNNTKYNHQDLKHSMVVFSPHQDDETLGCGGMIARKRQAGAEIKIVFMTDGSQSHAHLISADELKQLRRSEALAAAKTLGLSSSDVIFLEFPDGNLSQHQTAAQQRVREIMDEYEPQEVFIPYYQDGVPDHDLTNRIVTSVLVASAQEVTVYEYPIWFWSQCPWLTLTAAQKSDRSTYEQLARSKFSLKLLEEFCCSINISDVLDLKQQALEQHQSQVTRLNSNPQWTTLADVLDGKFIDCFFQDYEYFRQYSSSALPEINPMQPDPATSQSNDLAKALQVAAQYQKLNALEQAEQIYRQILQQLPNQADALYGLSLIAQRTGNYPEAEQLLQSVVNHQPQYFPAWFSLGNLYQSQNQLEAAVNAYQQAIKLKPQAYIVFNNLGYVYEQQGQPDQAITCYQQAIKIQPNCLEASASLGNILFSQGKLTQEQQMHYAALNNNLGFSCQSQKNYGQAVDYYRQAIALQPKLAIAHYNLGVTLNLSGNAPAEIQSCYQKVVELEPHTASTISQLASNKLKSIKALTTSQQPDTSRRLKIALISQPFVMTDFRQPMDSVGIIISELANRLASTCEVTVYAANSEAKADHHQGVTYQYIAVQQDLQSLGSAESDSASQNPSVPQFASDSYYQQFIQTVAKEIQTEGFDLVHIHNLSQFVPVIRALNPQTKIVLHMHCDWLNDLDYSLLSARLQEADLILSPSQHITEAIQQRFSQYANRCQTLFNGVNLERYVNGYIEGTGLRSDRQESVKRLLFVGRVCPEKGSHVLLEAFKQVLQQRNNVELTLVGAVGVIDSQFLISLSEDPELQALLPFHADNGSAWLEYLKTTVSELNTQQGAKPVNKVQAPGAIIPDRLAKYYHQADIFIFPSICYEAFGMPVAEAMVAGVPVITTRVGALSELVEDGKSGLLVERGNSDELAAAILKLLDDDKLRQSLGEAGCQRASQLFSFDRIADELLQKYQQLVSSST